MKIEQVQVVDKSVEDISTLQVPESYVASNVGEESKEETEPYNNNRRTGGGYSKIRIW